MHVKFLNDGRFTVSIRCTAASGASTGGVYLSINGAAEVLAFNFPENSSYSADIEQIAGGPWCIVYGNATDAPLRKYSDNWGATWRT